MERLANRRKSTEGAVVREAGNEGTHDQHRGRGTSVGAQMLDQVPGGFAHMWLLLGVDGIAGIHGENATKASLW